MRKEIIKCQIDLVEKEIVYFIGRKRAKAKRAHFRLLQSCGSISGLDKPMYFKTRARAKVVTKPGVVKAVLQVGYH